MTLMALSQFVIPTIAGGAGGFATGWLSWDIEKRRARFARRAQLVDRWRDELIGKLDAAAAEEWDDDLGFAFLSWPVYMAASTAALLAGVWRSSARSRGRLVEKGPRLFTSSRRAVRRLPPYGKRCRSLP